MSTSTTRRKPAEKAGSPFAGNPFAGPFTDLFTGSAFAQNPLAKAFAPRFDAPAADHAQAARAWMQLNRAMLEGVGKMQQEASRFVIRRLEQDLERQQQILASRSPAEALQLCAEHAQQAVQDYTTEAERLSEIAAEVQYACAGFGEMLAGEAVETEAAELRRKAAG